MKGFPGLLNTVRTLLDRSQVKRSTSNKCQKLELHQTQKHLFLTIQGSIMKNLEIRFHESQTFRKNLKDVH